MSSVAGLPDGSGSASIRPRMAGGFSFDSLNKAQRDAVASLDGPVLILAGAGTGKTRTVTCRISNMLQVGIAPENILAVTFTNKAASEMRERIGGMVSKKKAEAMTVCTFHSLCVRLLRGGIHGHHHDAHCQSFDRRQAQAMGLRLAS